MYPGNAEVLYDDAKLGATQLRLVLASMVGFIDLERAPIVLGRGINGRSGYSLRDSAGAGGVTEPWEPPPNFQLSWDTVGVLLIMPVR